MNKHLLHSEILFFEGESNYTRIHFNDGSKVLVSYTLKKVMEALPASSRFLRIHRTYVVNTLFVSDRIENPEGHYFILVNGLTLPISRRRRNVEF